MTLGLGIGLCLEESLFDYVPGEDGGFWKRRGWEWK